MITAACLLPVHKRLALKDAPMSNNTKVSRHSWSEHPQTYHSEMSHSRVPMVVASCTQWAGSGGGVREGFEGEGLKEARGCKGKGICGGERGEIVKRCTNERDWFQSVCLMADHKHALALFEDRTSTGAVCFQVFFQAARKSTLLFGCPTFSSKGFERYFAQKTIFNVLSNVTEIIAETVAATGPEVESLSFDWPNETSSPSGSSRCVQRFFS